MGEDVSREWNAQSIRHFAGGLVAQWFIDNNATPDPIIREAREQLEAHLTEWWASQPSEIQTAVLDARERRNRTVKVTPGFLLQLAHGKRTWEFTVGVPLHRSDLPTQGKE